MSDRLTESQLSQVVAEVQKLSDRRNQELDKAEIQKVLSELNLPPELYDEAIVQLQRRQALKNQQRQFRWLIGGAAAIVFSSIGGILFFQYQGQQKLDRITAQQSRMSLPRDDGSDRRSIGRQDTPEIYYRVTLKDAPIGEKLSLSCDWMNPSNQIIHQSRYETKEIKITDWNTACRLPIDRNMPTGTWKVRMVLGNRSIADAAFEVK
jgi:hypothetical protein